MRQWVSPDDYLRLLEAWPLAPLAGRVLAVLVGLVLVSILGILLFSEEEDEDGIGSWEPCLGDFLQALVLGGMCLVCCLVFDGFLYWMDWYLAGVLTGYFVVMLVSVLLLLVLFFPLWPLTRHLPERLVFGVATPWLAVAVWACWVLSEEAEQLRIERARREGMVAQPLRQARRRRPKTLPRGVAMDREGALVGWVAAPPNVQVDQEHERRLGAAARRVVPFRVVLLNNSFQDLGLGAGKGVAWRVRLTHEGKMLQEWAHEVGPGGLTMDPAERLEWRVEWDGRDPEGRLVGQGEYLAKLFTPAPPEAEAGLAAAARFWVSEVGPVVEVIRDPTQEILRGMRETEQMHRMLQRGVADLERHRAFQLERQRWQWQMHRSRLPPWSGS